MKIEIMGSYTDVELGTVVHCLVTEGSIKPGVNIKGIGNVLNLHRYGRQIAEAKAGSECSIIVASFAGRVGDVVETT